MSRSTPALIFLQERFEIARTVSSRIKADLLQARGPIRIPCATIELCANLRVFVNASTATPPLHALFILVWRQALDGGGLALPEGETWVVRVLEIYPSRDGRSSAGFVVEVLSRLEPAGQIPPLGSGSVAA